MPGWGVNWNSVSHSSRTSPGGRNTPQNVWWECMTLTLTAANRLWLTEGLQIRQG